VYLLKSLSKKVVYKYNRSYNNKKEAIMAKFKAHHPRSVKATARRVLKKRK
jgi:hypothetical protein